MGYTGTALIELIADPNTDSRLLPGFMVQGTNIKDIEHLKIALKMAMCNFLTDEQREILRMRYVEELSVTEIGVRIGLTPSAACKRIKTAKNILRKHADYAVRVYQQFEKVYL